jgi:hypothetical protein
VPSIVRFGEVHRVFRVAPFVVGGVRPFDLLLLIGFAILFVGLIVWLIRRTDGDRHDARSGPTAVQGWAPPAGPGGPPIPAADPALEILRARFARGEIGEDEFVSASRALAQTPR